MYPIQSNPPDDYNSDDFGDPWGNPDPILSCDFLGDPDCDDGDSGGGSDGGGEGDADHQACIAWYAMRDDECLIDPIDQYHYNWDPFGASFRTLFYWNFTLGLPSQGFPDFGASTSTYQNIIENVAHAYWQTQTQFSISQAYWDSIHDYCADFPLESILSANRTDCYLGVYSVSLRLIPSFSDHAFTISQVEGRGVTIEHLSSGNPFANWAAQLLGDFIKVKECKIWFDGKEDITGCE